MRALPDEWWEQQRSADPRTEYRMSPEELAENKRQEEQRELLRAQKHKALARDRAAVLVRAQALIDLDKAKAGKVRTVVCACVVRPVTEMSVSSGGRVPEGAARGEGASCEQVRVIRAPVVNERAC